jgi:hypothetical protein
LFRIIVYEVARFLSDETASGNLRLNEGNFYHCCVFFFFFVCFVFSVLLCCKSTLNSLLDWNIMFVILCVVYYFECVYVLFFLCIVVLLPPGTYPLEVDDDGYDDSNNVL